MATNILYSSDGPQLTVNAMIKQPTYIARRVLDITGQSFLADQLLRNAGSMPGGAAVFFANTPLYADTAVEIVAEGAEIPVGMGSTGTPLVVKTVKRALGVEITQEMQDRNDTDQVNTRIQQVRNSLIRAWDTVFLTAAKAGAQTVAATASWASGGTSKIRTDLAAAIKKINTAVDSQGSLFGFSADTLVLNTGDVVDFISSDDVSKVFIGNIANLNPQFTGQIPTTGRNFFGLDIFVSPNQSAGTAVAMQRKVLGFIGDERPLQATPLYRINQREVWRSDTLRRSAVGIDYPSAVCTITGI